MNEQKGINKHRKLAELIYRAMAERAQIFEQLTEKVAGYLATINEAFRYASVKMQVVDPRSLESILTWLETEIKRLEADGINRMRRPDTCMYMRPGNDHISKRTTEND